MSLSEQIKEEAKRLGFYACGIAEIRDVREEKKHIDSWLDASFNGDMEYMERNKEKRLDPSLLVEGAKSIIVVLFNYYQEEIPRDVNKPIISKYAYGKDYHDIVKGKLFKLYEYISQKTEGIQGRCFVDSAPVLEHFWAKEAGLGWIGKNSLLLNKELGSYSFIGEIVSNINLDYDQPYQKEYCGNCSACIDACPTQAIISPKVIDARKCISYNTIEFEGEIPESIANKLDCHIFGCDICQDVCPWNKKKILTDEVFFAPNSELLNLSYQEWLSLSEERFSFCAKKTPFKRAGLSKIKKTIEIIKKGKGA